MSPGTERWNDHKPVEDGNYDKLLSGCPCDDRQWVSIVVAPPAEMGARFPNHRPATGRYWPNSLADIGQADGAQLGPLVLVTILESE